MWDEEFHVQLWLNEFLLPLRDTKGNIKDHQGVIPFSFTTPFVTVKQIHQFRI